MTRIKPSCREKGKSRNEGIFQHELREWSFWTPHFTGTQIHRLPVIIAIAAGIRQTRKPMACPVWFTQSLVFFQAQAWINTPIASHCPASRRGAPFVHLERIPTVSRDAPPPDHAVKIARPSLMVCTTATSRICAAGILSGLRSRTTKSVSLPTSSVPFVFSSWIWKAASAVTARSAV